MKSKIEKIIVSLIVVLVVGVLIFVFFGKKENEYKNVSLDAFAQCVTSKGLVMYGAYWCPHCQNEKKAFGDSFKYITYVECGDNPKLCTDKGVSALPTWILSDGQKLLGEQGIEGLAKVTGCQVASSAAISE